MFEGPTYCAIDLEDYGSILMDALYTVEGL
jgi:hypothetical protein